MCGIVGYVGTKPCKSILLDGLSTLEYRGYDSAGISFCENHQIQTIKTVGKVSTLKEICKDNISDSFVGIGHTRWATHGIPSTTNAHPHVSPNQTWSIVHNGIIENYLTLRQTCTNPFSSQTDSEVISHLLEQHQHNQPLQSLIDTCRELKGSYALACLHKDYQQIFLAKLKNPLYIAYAHDGYMISSDVATFYGYAETYYTLEDYEFAVVGQNIQFYNEHLEIIKKDCKILPNNQQKIDKGKFPYFMEKEINEIPLCLTQTKQYYDTKPSPISIIPFQNYHSIHLIGCGTAYHACIMGSLYFEHYAKLTSTATIASEFRYQNPILSKQTLYILVSQSGETADTLACTEQLLEAGCDCLAITNVPHSKLSQICTYVLPTICNAEISVASTKVYNTQLYVLYLLAKSWGIPNQEIEELEINKIPLYISKLDDQLIDVVNSSSKIIFVGKNEDYITAKEASLKLKEISYINSIALPCGELKHGSIALIDEDCVVIVICTKKRMIDKINNCIAEVTSRKGKVIVLSMFEKEQFLDHDFFIPLHTTNEEHSSIVSIIPLQMLAYQIAKKRNLNPDQPRNLAKSVTVE